MRLGKPTKQADCWVWVLSDNDKCVVIGVSGFEVRQYSGEDKKAKERAILSAKVRIARIKLRNARNEWPVVPNINEMIEADSTV